MALIDCLLLINGHMLNMHILDGNLRRGAISGEALISGCELSIWDGLVEGNQGGTALPHRPQSQPSLYGSDTEDI